MGMSVPPDEYQRHRVTIEVRGPIDKTKWASYRAAVKALVAKYGARITEKRRLRKTTSAKKK
jgi:hypothetical protein